MTKSERVDINQSSPGVSSPKRIHPSRQSRHGSKNQNPPNHSSVRSIQSKGHDPQEKKKIHGKPKLITR
ncbi:hypothetical protein VTJ04DRAFT_8255 [Mycothermus thermophilus]|uniref:uncharacterized protein n=1 Tax=Humicola insolens TaxID=85995 RepID=UPI00374329C2